MEKYELEHIEILRTLAPECMVLLKTDGSFPLEAPGKIALYGNGARNTIKGGTGSGDVNVRSFVTAEQGLQNAGFTITTGQWLDAYDALWQAERKKFRAGLKAKIAKEGLSALMQSMGAVMPEPEYQFPMDGEGNTALYVLSRVSGEGYDRKAIPGDFELTRESMYRAVLPSPSMGSVYSGSGITAPMLCIKADRPSFAILALRPARNFFRSACHRAS